MPNDVPIASPVLQYLSSLALGGKEEEIVDVMTAVGPSTVAQQNTLVLIAIRVERIDIVQRLLAQEESLVIHCSKELK